MKSTLMQATFNKVYTHLNTQRKPSVNRRYGQCLYRNYEKGAVLKCAIGCLIPDKKYKDTMEGYDVLILRRRFDTSTYLKLPVEFYNDLQMEHDEWSDHRSIRKWRKGMKDVAFNWGLDDSIVK